MPVPSNFIIGSHLDYPKIEKAFILHPSSFCVASIHSAFELPETEQTARLLCALEHPFLAIIANHTGRFLVPRDLLKLNIRQVMEAAARHEGAMEVNSWPERLDLNDVHLLLSRELGVPLVIDTDAHHPEYFTLLKFGLATARRGWPAPADVLNMLPLPQLLTRLRRRAKWKAA